MAQTNRKLDGGLETVFLDNQPAVLVSELFYGKEVAAFGGDISQFCTGHRNRRDTEEIDKKRRV